MITSDRHYKSMHSASIVTLVYTSSAAIFHFSIQPDSLLIVGNALCSDITYRCPLFVLLGRILINIQLVVEQ